MVFYAAAHEWGEGGGGGGGGGGEGVFYVTHLLSSADISICSPEISKFAISRNADIY